MQNKFQKELKDKEYLKILEYKRVNPAKSLRDTGMVFHKSGERIRQILEILKGKGLNWEPVDNLDLPQVDESIIIK